MVTVEAKADLAMMAMAEVTLATERVMVVTAKPTMATSLVMEKATLAGAQGAEEEDIHLLVMMLMERAVMEVAELRLATHRMVAMQATLHQDMEEPLLDMAIPHQRTEATPHQATGVPRLDMMAMARVVHLAGMAMVRVVGHPAMEAAMVWAVGESHAKDLVHDRHHRSRELSKRLRPVHR